MSTPCFLLYIGTRPAASARGVGEFFLSVRNSCGVSHRTKDSEHKSDLDFVGTRGFNEKHEPLTVIVLANGLSALYFLTAVRAAQNKIVWLRSVSKGLIKSAGGFDFMNCYSMPDQKDRCKPEQEFSRPESLQDGPLCHKESRDQT